MESLFTREEKIDILNEIYVETSLNSPIDSRWRWNENLEMFTFSKSDEELEGNSSRRRYDSREDWILNRKKYINFRNSKWIYTDAYVGSTPNKEYRSDTFPGVIMAEIQDSIREFRRKKKAVSSESMVEHIQDLLCWFENEKDAFKGAFLDKLDSRKEKKKFLIRSL
jgi:hypothetical protein